MCESLTAMLKDDCLIFLSRRIHNFSTYTVSRLYISCVAYINVINIEI